MSSDSVRRSTDSPPPAGRLYPVRARLRDGAELIRAARTVGLRRVCGDILASNLRMLALMASLGFDLQPVPEDPLLRRAVKTI